MEEAIADLLLRLGVDEPTSFAEPEKLAKMWEKRRSLFEHLARTAYQFWVAEQNGRLWGLHVRPCMMGCWN